MLARALFLIFSALQAVSPEMAEQVEASVIGNHYVHVDTEGRMSLWQETNGIPGLQVKSLDANLFGIGYASDTRVLL